MDALATTGKKRRARNATGVGPGRRRSRKRYELRHTADLDPLSVYRHHVSTSLAVRRERLSTFIKRTVAHVKQTKRWTLERLLREAKVSKPIYYRWVNGDWEKDLEPSHLERFCDAAGVPVALAFEILWPGKFSKTGATPPMPNSPEFEVIMRKLNDPTTSKEDLYLINATLEMLLSRIAPEAKPRKQV